MPIHPLPRLVCTNIFDILVPLSTLDLLALIHSNYNTHSLYHFENPAIVAMKSDIVTFIHVKSIKVTSGFNLRIMKKIRQVALSYRNIKNKY